MRRVASHDKIIGGNKISQEESNKKKYVKDKLDVGVPKKTWKWRPTYTFKWYKQPRQIYFIMMFIREKILRNRKIPKRIQNRLSEDAMVTVKDMLIDITVNCLQIEILSVVIEAMLSMSISSSEVGPLEIMFHAYKIISTINHQ